MHTPRRLPPSPRLAVPLGLLGVLGCEPFGPAQPGPGSPGETGPALRAEPEVLDFGTVDVAAAADRWTLSFTLRNELGEAQTVEGLGRIWGGEARFTSAAPPLLELGVGESVEIPVVFTPGTEGVWEAFIAPSSLIQVELRGAGAAPVARLVASATAADPVWVGCAGVLDAALLNDGSRPLSVHSLALSGSSDFTLLSTAPEVLDPGELLPIRVQFTPTVAGPQSVQVVLQSDDPAAPTRELALDALGVPGAGVTEDLSYTPTVRADWLFVVDTAPAMSDTLDLAQTEVLGLLEGLDAAAVDWQIAVVTDPSACYATADPYLYPGVFGRYDPERVAPALAVALNPSAAGTPALLDLALASVERTDRGDCLEGLLRAGAQLHVVLVSNRAEASSTATAAALAGLAERLSQPELLRVSAVTGQGGSCTAGGAAVEAARASGGAVLDLCGGGWDAHFAALVEVSAEAAGGAFSWTLEQVPVPSTLALRAGGRTLTRWSWDAASNTVTVDGDAEDLEPGDPITASYTAAQACEEE